MPISIGVHIEGAEEVLRDLARAGSKAHTEARKSVREASFAVERRIKQEMPVDTGRARASWGHWTPGDMAAPNINAGEDDAVWEVQDAGLTIVQGSNVEYIAALNEGHSQQRAAGFIDRAVEAGQRYLIEEVDKMLDRLLR